MTFILFCCCCELVVFIVGIVEILFRQLISLLFVYEIVNYFVCVVKGVDREKSKMQYFMNIKFYNGIDIFFLHISLISFSIKKNQTVSI